MAWLHFFSSWVVAVQYDAGDLYIEFKSGVTCWYQNVPLDMWTDLLTAPSKGQWVNQNLASKKWPYTVI